MWFGLGTAVRESTQHGVGSWRRGHRSVTAFQLGFPWMLRLAALPAGVLLELEWVCDFPTAVLSWGWHLRVPEDTGRVGLWTGSLGIHEFQHRGERLEVCHHRGKCPDTV